MSQLELFKTTKLDAEFDDFHAKNPAVFEMFYRFAQQAYESGRKRIGAKMIAERIRWETAISPTSPDYKVNNSYISRYARLCAQKYPELGNLFTMRKLKS